MTPAFFVFLTFVVHVMCRLEQGVDEAQFSFQSQQRYVHFQKSAFKGSYLEVKMSCKVAGAGNADEATKLNVDAVVRSSPCAKEFYGTLGSNPTSTNETEGVLQIYFDDKQHLYFEQFNYKSFWFAKSDVESIPCDGRIVQLSKTSPFLTEKVNGTVVPAANRRKRDESSSGDKKSPNATVTVTPTKTGPIGSDLKTDHPWFELTSDEVYLLIVRFDNPSMKNIFVNITVEWKNRAGYLGPIDWPLLPFYGVMCGVYSILALAWLIMSFYQWRDLLRIQFWIGAVIGLGLIEKMIFYMEHQTVNHTGSEIEGAIEFAEIFSCLKRTLSYMLVVIVSVGFGVVKPRLGSTLHKVVGFGFVFFLICSIEAMVRVSEVQHESTRQKQLIMFPYVLVQLIWVYWVFTSLINTMRALRLRRNEVKLSMYRHFTHTLIFSCVASVGYMLWSLFVNRLNTCVKDWKELWVDIAFWHVLFSVILCVIMILWRPTNNNQRYAFSPLLDNDDDAEDEEDTVFSEAFTSTEAMKLRSTQSSTTKAENRKNKENKENSLEDDLKWVEQHIPSSLADKTLPAFVDSDEEREHSKFEISKMQ